jgi:hypothetical protein
MRGSPPRAAAWAGTAAAACAQAQPSRPALTTVEQAQRDLGAPAGRADPESRMADRRHHPPAPSRGTPRSGCRCRSPCPSGHYFNPARAWDVPCTTQADEASELLHPRTTGTQIGPRRRQPDFPFGSSVGPSSSAGLGSPVGDQAAVLRCAEPAECRSVPAQQIDALRHSIAIRRREAPEPAPGPRGEVDVPRHRPPEPLAGRDSPALHRSYDTRRTLKAVTDCAGSADSLGSTGESSRSRLGGRPRRAPAAGAR